MLDLLFSNPLIFVVWAVALVISVTIHEFSHAWMADRLGDPTARLAGRLTLNPLAHLDPVGTLALLIANIGWGKPVPIDPYNLRYPRRDSAIISLAGPGSNLILAAILALFLRLPFVSLSLGSLVSLLYPLIVLSVGLGVFNLIPIPPLDGAKIVLGILPIDLALKFEETTSQFGILLLLFIIFPLFGGNSLIGLIISPIINLILSFLLPFKFL